MKLRLWPHFIFFLLAINFFVVGITVYVATTDPSFAVVPDYYTKAVEWDATKERQAASDAAGWKVHVAAIPIGSDMFIRAIVLDENSQHVENATVTAQVFHSRYAAEQSTLEFVPATPGTYDAAFPSLRAGEWNIKLTIKRDGDTYLGSHQLHLLQRIGDQVK